MAPSAALQSRISVFEALGTENNGRQNLKGNVQLSPLSVTHSRPEVHILDSGSTSPTADSLSAIPPIQPVPSPSRPSSPIALGRKSSLIDFSELTTPSLNPISTNGTGSTTSSSATSDSSRKIQLPHPVSSRIPPLPPRKPSVTSLKTTSIKTPPPLPKRHTSSSSSTFSTSTAPSLLLPSDTHTYPPPSPKLAASPGFQSRHMPSSSTSSFHSVSLSSDGGVDTLDSTETRDSLDGSYEAVSSTAATSPTSHEWEHDLYPKPKLPQRPWQKQSLPSPLVSAPPPVPRRQAPPPPPPKVIRSTTSGLPSLSHHRPPPLPPNARKRYDALFDRNNPQKWRKGHASGWRGLSVDLLTADEKPEADGETPNVDRLDGVIVKQIWSCSRLPRARLRQIWSECDPDGQGSLDRDAFAKGMWRIDEELSRGQDRARPSPFNAVSISYAPRAPPPPLRKPNFLLR